MLVHYFATLLCITLFVLIVYFCSVCFDGSCLTEIHLKRLAISALLSYIFAFWGKRRKSLDWTGAISGFFVGLLLTFSSYCFLACMLTFFLTSSKATHYGSAKKKRFEADFKEGGQRNWIQVICNGGMAVEVAALYLVEGGAGESPLNFNTHFVRSWLAAAVLSTLAGVNGDTWASELGTVSAKTEPRLITNFKRVPIGTNGGFTLHGLLFSALGGLIIGFSYFIALLFTIDIVDKFHQAVLLSLMGIFAGIFGSVFDSLMGATLQYSGLEIRSGKVVEEPGAGVQHISGSPVLSNHSVNLIMSVLNSILVPSLFVKLYSLFL